MNKYVLCLSESSFQPSSMVPSLSFDISLRRMKSQGDVKMTGEEGHKNGNNRIAPTSGKRTMVALSSINLVLGSSPATVSGANRAAATRLGPIQK